MAPRLRLPAPPFHTHLPLPRNVPSPILCIRDCLQHNCRLLKVMLPWLLVMGGAGKIRCCPARFARHLLLSTQRDYRASHPTLRVRIDWKYVVTFVAGGMSVVYVRLLCERRASRVVDSASIADELTSLRFTRIWPSPVMERPPCFAYAISYTVIFAC